MADSGSAKDRARQRAAAARAEQQKADKRRRTMVRGSIAGGVVVVIVAVVLAVVLGGGGSSNKTPTTTPTTTSALGPEGIPIEQGTVLASAASAATGATIDGIQCDSSEQVAYHVHAHLAVYVNGSLRPTPLGIGIVTPVVQKTSTGDFASASKCYYWLHTHAQDGIIHIESPTQALYTLGQFFDEWKQPLSSSQVASAKGTVTAYVNGKLFTGDPRTIQLKSHAVIQLDVGNPSVKPQSVNWSTSTL